MRGCFARGSVLSLSCVGFDTGPNAGKNVVVSNSTVGCDGSCVNWCLSDMLKSVNLRDVSRRLLKIPRSLPHEPA